MYNFFFNVWEFHASFSLLAKEVNFRFKDGLDSSASIMERNRVCGRLCRSNNFKARFDTNQARIGYSFRIKLKSSELSS